MFGLGKKTEAKEAAPALTDDQLRLLDYIVMVDNSGSMSSPSHRMRGTRLQEVQQDVMRIAEQAEKFDSDGITVVEFASNSRISDGVGALKVATVFKHFADPGSTNLAAGLRDAIKKAKSSKKNVVVIVFTDGQPDSKSEAMAEIDLAGKTLGRPKIGFTFVQVGNDPGATRFLDALDNEMNVDVVATVRAEKAEKLDFRDLVWLAQNA